MAASLDRRELLLGLLGLPLAALVGCGETRPMLPQHGEILGAGHDLGHRVRTAALAMLADEQCERLDVAIIGGGIAGLAAARHLKHAGVERIAVLELEPSIGGTSRAGQYGAQAYPWGAHYLPAPMKENVALVKLLDEFGAVNGYSDNGQPVFAEEMLVRDPEERLFVGGQWHEGLWPSTIATAADIANLETFHREVERWVAWRDGQARRAFALPIATCSDDAEATALDRQSFANWLDERGLTAPVFRWWVEYATRDDYGTTLAQTSAWAGLFYFASRVVSHVTEPQPLLTWPEGNGWLVQQLAAGVQAHLRLNQAVLRVEPHSAGVKLLAIGPTGAPRGYLCQQVIFAAPHFLAPYVLAGFPAARRDDTKAFTYGAWLVANLKLRERPANVGFEAAWDNVFYHSNSLGYVSATHQRGRDHGPTTWTYYLPLTDDEPAQARQRLLQLDWQACADVVLTDLDQAHADLRPLVERLDVMRWGHAMVQPRVGFMFGGARQREQAAWGNIHFAHSDLSGVALFEEAFDRGTRAAETVVAALKRK